MTWATEDSPVGEADSPIATEQCAPCLDRFNPVFITGTTSSVIINGESHLNHYIVQSTVPVTFFLQPAVLDSVDLTGMICLITRDTITDVIVSDASVEPSILRGQARIDAQGDSIGIISVTSTQYVIAGATRLVA